MGSICTVSVYKLRNRGLRCSVYNTSKHSGLSQCTFIEVIATEPHLVSPR